MAECQFISDVNNEFGRERLHIKVSVNYLGIRLPVYFRTSWISATFISGNHCCTVLPSFTPRCRRGGNSDQLGGTYLTSLTNQISPLQFNSCRTIWMTSTPRRYELQKYWVYGWARYNGTTWTPATGQTCLHFICLCSKVLSFLYTACSSRLGVSMFSMPIAIHKCFQP